ncbi:C1 family peptidase [Halobacteriovorax sp. HLS]|uniref:C1 family peptidase n=1 Tax=Halobacteriovorax sp. HLS TaxID=2234000 RepID=UPI000FDB0935|nr:C1 family peptidase [Halobacteriovorax sp. HLS]
MIKLLLLLTAMSVSAKTVDLKQYQGPVKNQLDRNTCAYFAVTALVEGVIKQKFNKSYDISEQFQIYYGKEYFNEYSDKEYGSTSDIAMNFTKQYFFMKEADVPYQTSYFEPNRPCENEDPFDTSSPSYCFSQAPLEWDSSKKVKVDGLKYDWITGLWSPGKTRAQLIEQRIDKGRPVVLTLKVYAPQWDNAHVTYTEETDKLCESGTYQCYGHAIVLTGYDDVKKIFHFKNSWGTNWGNAGYGTMSYDYVNNYSDSPVSVYFDRILGNIRE